MHRSWSPGAGAPALPAAAAVAAGIALGVALPLAPTSAMAVSFVAAGLLAFGLGLGARRIRLASLGALVLLLAAGFQAGRERLASPVTRDEAAVGALPDDNVVTVTGRLSGPWSASGAFRRGEIEPDRSEIDGRTMTLNGPISILCGGLGDPLEVAGPGDLVRVTGTLRNPEPEGGERGPLRVLKPPRLRIKSAEQMERLAPPTGLLGPVLRLHRFATLRLKANLSAASPEERRALSLLMALLLGETADLPPSTASAFRDGGVAHVLAISGLQVAMVAWTCHVLLSFLPLLLWQRDLAVLAATFSFAAFAGGGAPVTRAALMVGFYIGARLLGRPTSPWQVVGLSAVVLLLVRPANLLDVGFLLTFGAVSGLAAFGTSAARLLEKAGVGPPLLAQLLGATLGAEAAVFPIQAYVFNVVPFVALLSNLVVVPLSNVFFFGGIALVPFLLFSRAVAAVAIVPLRLGSDGLLALLDLLDRMRAFRFVPAPSFWEVALLAACLWGAAAARRRRLVAGLLFAGAFGLGSVILLRPATVASPGTALFQAVDVGQGDAWLLATPHGRVLVDGGGSYDTAYDFGRLKLLPRLAAFGAVSFDAVVLTHPHPDHSRGLVAVVRLMPVGRLYVAKGAPRNEFLEELLEAARLRSVPVERVGAGDSFQAAGLGFEVLHPGPDAYPRSVENNGSLVLATRMEGRRLLLTGDIEKLAEQDLVDQGTPLAADVLKVCHHGSRTSTTAPFLAAVAPRVGVIGVGRHNPFGHPSETVLERLRAAGVRVFRTDRDGDIGLLLRGRLVSPLFAAATPGLK